MKQPLQLNSFAITLLHIDWHQGEADVSAEEMVEARREYDYDIFRSPENDRLYALKFRFKSVPVPEALGSGYAIDTEIVGFFEFPPSMKEEEVTYLIRMNGCTILYGILRGQLSVFTGAFPGGQYVLPAVYMEDVVKGVENRKAEAKKRKAPRKYVAKRKGID